MNSAGSEGWLNSGYEFSGVEASSGGGREEGIAGDRRAAGRGRKLGGKGRYCGESGGGVVVVERAGCREIRKWGRRGDGAPAETGVGERAVSAREGS